MATVAYQIEQPAAGDNFPEGTRVVTWTGLTTTNNDGAPYVAPHRSDKSVHFSGTYGAGGSVRMEGSNRADGGVTNWPILHDPSHGAGGLVSTVESIEQVLENTWAIRPHVTAGDGTTSLTVRLLVTTVARR